MRLRIVELTLRKPQCWDLIDCKIIRGNPTSIRNVGNSHVLDSRTSDVIYVYLGVPWFPERQVDEEKQKREYIKTWHRQAEEQYRVFCRREEIRQKRKSRQEARTPPKPVGRRS